VYQLPLTLVSGILVVVPGLSQKLKRLCTVKNQLILAKALEGILLSGLKPVAIKH